MEDKFKVDHLILLVGGNPLPNAVAGKLLVKPGGTITLIHSDGTVDVAKRLRAWFQKHQVTQDVQLKEVKESDPTSIFQGVQECLNKAKLQTVGLNYTGGTKVMSVHAYRAVEQWISKRGITAVFSYLDARTLEMLFDPVNSQDVKQRIYVGRELQLKIDDFLALHGWTLKHNPRRDALLPATARALAKACSNDDGFQRWIQWIDCEFLPKCRRSDKEDWKKEKELMSVSLAMPADTSLREVVNSLRSELNMDKDSDELSLVHKYFENKPERFCEWLYGKWLEHHVLDILNNLSESLHLHERAQNVVPSEVEFDVDVVALRGYQLFAFSCSTDTKKGLLKLKLFEAYVRARQLGGDEARVALVCCSDDPERIEHEMRRDVDPEERIRVFGRKHLDKLDEHLATWIRSQIGVDPEK